MPIERMYWDNEGQRDIHVLLGQTTRAPIDLLRFVNAQGGGRLAASYLAKWNDVTLEFRPRLVMGQEVNGMIPCNGLVVNKATGAVTAASPAPVKHRRYNFILEAIATHTPQAGGVRLPPLPIRVHLHEAVTDLWLSPPTLTLRQGVPDEALPESTPFRFSVRARFDDDTVGDLTEHHGVKWTAKDDKNPDGGAAAQWSVDTAGRLSIAPGMKPGGTVTITATLPPELGGKAASGKLVIAEPWNALPSPVQAERVTGSGVLPDAAIPHEETAILVLGDGFDPSDRTTFDPWVDGVVRRLRISRLTRPFDLLANTMQFWKALPPAGGRGISFRGEFYTWTDDKGTQHAEPIPAVWPTTGAEKSWNVRHLLYAVGLPIPADRGRSVAALREEWSKVVGPEHQLADDKVVCRWKKMAKREFLEEVDAFPGMSFGAPPHATAYSTNMLDLHPERGGFDELLRFLGNLTEAGGSPQPAGATLGDRWGAQNNGLGTVVLLSAFPGGRANAGQAVVMCTREWNEPIPVAAVQGRQELTPAFPSPPLLNIAMSARVMAHELGHRLGLGDEYVEPGKPYWKGGDPPHANLQNDDPALFAAGGPKPGDIKWDWHRIRKAAVLTGKPVSLGDGSFRVPVRRGDALAFKKSDRVLLRKRESALRLTTQPDVLAGELCVTRPPAAPGDALVVKAAPEFDLENKFGAGCLLFVPVPSPVPAETYARLVAHNIRAHMASKGPLTGSPCETSLEKRVSTPRLEGVDLPWCFKDLPRVVGLYHGGDWYACGIFHPTGTCMMGDSDYAAAEFCAVCRYVLVDLVDPARHGVIDADYEEIYPQR